MRNLRKVVSFQDAVTKRKLTYLTILEKNIGNHAITVALPVPVYAFSSVLLTHLLISEMGTVGYIR